jgi:ABC-type nitrate/sulfonate/bicarbonate transport system permease component
MRRDSRVLGLTIEVGATLALLAVIWFSTENSSSPYFPSLSTILVTFRQTWLFSDFGTDLLPSLERLFAGYLIGVAAGVLAGILFGTSTIFRMLFRPFAAFLRSVPPPVLIPPAIVLLGIGGSEKIAIIAFVCMWPIALNTEDGMLGIDPTVLDTARAYSITGLRRLRLVVLPAVAPRIFVGMRFSLSLAVTMLVVAEMIASSNGVGFFVLSAEQSFSIPQMWAGILMLGLLGYGLNLGLSIIERRVIGWHLRSTGADL